MFIIYVVRFYVLLVLCCWVLCVLVICVVGSMRCLGSGVLVLGLCGSMCFLVLCVLVICVVGCLFYWLYVFVLYVVQFYV